MNYIQVELKKTKFVAYLFDGTEESNKEFCQKWNCHTVEDFLDKNFVSIVLPDGIKCYTGNYIVIDENKFMKRYTPTEFVKTFNVIQNYRQDNYLFISED